MAAAPFALAGAYYDVYTTHFPSTVECRREDSSPLVGVHEAKPGVSLSRRELRPCLELGCSVS